MNQVPILIFQSAVSVLSWTKLLNNLTIHFVFNQKGKSIVIVKDGIPKHRWSSSFKPL